MSVQTSESPNVVYEAILDAAGRLLERYGYKKMTVEDIAHEAEIGKGSVYLHFKSKEDVALSWMDRASMQLRAEMRSIAESSLDIPDRMKQMLVTRVMFRFNNAQHFIEGIDDLFGHGCIRKGLLTRRRTNHEAEAAILQEVIEEGHRQGVLAAYEASAAAHAIVTATNSLLPYNLSASQLGHRDEILERISEITDLLLYGLVNRD